MTAKYAGEDAGNYEVESVEITLTRKACTHPTTKWIVYKEATVDAEGSRHKECTVCKTVLATETIAKLKAQTPDVTICYTTHVQTYGWQGNENNPNTWRRDGDMSGTSGEAKRLEAIRIALTGEMAEHYDVYYRVHAQSFGWLGWAKNGEAAGTAGLAKRLEGIQIVLVPKGGNAPARSYQGITSVKTQAYIKK